MAGTEYDQHAAWYTEVVQRRGLLHLRIIPRIMAFISDVTDQSVVDVCCGEGIFTRELAARGAVATGVDLSENMLRFAKAQTEHASPTYIQDDARTLSRLPNEAFDGAICVMALMDVNDIGGVFGSVHRVTRDGGWFVVVITHPCFDAPNAHTQVVNGVRVCSTSRYLTEGYWRGDSHGVRSKVGAWHRTLSTYLNLAIDANWNLERVMEPEVVNIESSAPDPACDLPALLLLRFAKR